MMEIHVEFNSEFESDTVFDADEVMVSVGGRTLAEFVSAICRRLGCETTEPAPEGINGWFWNTTYKGRAFECQAVDLEPALIIFRIPDPRRFETYFALLTLLDRELKQEPTLGDFHWFRAQGGRYIDIGATPVRAASHPDPIDVLAKPEAYDLPPTWIETCLRRLFRRPG